MELIIGLIFGIPLYIWLWKLSYKEGGATAFGKAPFVPAWQITLFWIVLTVSLIGIYVLAYLLYGTS